MQFAAAESVYIQNVPLQHWQPVASTAVTATVAAQQSVADSVEPPLSRQNLVLLLLLLMLLKFIPHNQPSEQASATGAAAAAGSGRAATMHVEKE